jgi:hypothetical protein
VTYSIGGREYLSVSPSEPQASCIEGCIEGCIETAYKIDGDIGRECADNGDTVDARPELLE